LTLVGVSLRVRPGASRTAVGGAHSGALVVRVSARAGGGAATEAALRAVASAFGVRRRDVRLVHGSSSRDKLVEIDADPAAVEAARARLLALGAGQD
jgi:uncharacterized protein YggU (UPF0235/DUF167 family)